MRIKKGFTLAEILIVLMVIGVIATMTIPSLMKGVAEAQYKAAYKKGYNAIVNLAAMEKVAGQLPTKSGVKRLGDFAESMFSNLSVKEFVAKNALDGGDLVNSTGTVSALEVTSSQSDSKRKIGPGTSGGDFIICKAADCKDVELSWMMTDDGIGYALLAKATDDDCGLKAEIATSTDSADAFSKSCGIVVVDVNGLYKGPNRLEIQNTTGTSSSNNKADYVASTSKMATLSRDRYYIYLGSDGATAGPAATTVSGRIIADMK